MSLHGRDYVELCAVGRGGAIPRLGTKTVEPVRFSGPCVSGGCEDVVEESKADEEMGVEKETPAT